jgi:hypothetical protein
MPWRKLPAELAKRCLNSFGERWLCVYTGSL